MGSHGNWNGIKLTIGKRGIVFTKAPSRFNKCVGKHLRGAKGGGRSGVRKRFEDAVAACK